MHTDESMTIVLATDSFKGCLTSQEVEAALAVVLRAKGKQVLCLPMSDGGDGMLDAFSQAMKGELREAVVHDPMMRTVKARYAVCPNGTAIIESAQACGLHLMSRDERNPLKATTYGVGELLLVAMNEGCRDFIIGLGGSGTSDCGRGMLMALAQKLTCGQLEALPAHPMIRSCRFILASDVQNPLYGPMGAARIYGGQKGASPAMQEELDRLAMDFATQSAQLIGHDESLSPGAGSAGGLGYAFLQYLGATAQSGADILLQSIQFATLIKGANLIITGEGSADRQTLMGKLPMHILRQSQMSSQVPVWLIAGRVNDREQLLQAGFQRVECINPAHLPQAEATRPEVAKARLKQWAENNF